MSNYVTLKSHIRCQLSGGFTANKTRHKIEYNKTKSI